MTLEEQIKALAELDGIQIREVDCPLCGHGVTHPSWFDKDGSATCVKGYLHSYDDIVPLIQKQPDDVRQRFFYELCKVKGHEVVSNPYMTQITITHLQFADTILSPTEQFCEALLRATGKWKD